MFGGAIDVSPLVHARDAVVPVAVALSLFALVAVVTPPARAPVATFVLLPPAWYHSVVLALPTVSELLRIPSLRRATLVAAVGLAVPLLLLNFLAKLVARPPIVFLLALQPASILRSARAVTEGRREEG